MWGSSRDGNLARLGSVLRWRNAALLVVALGAACEGDPGSDAGLGDSVPREGALPDGVAALVGPAEVSVVAVQAVATAEATPPREARRRLIDDALFATEAEQRFAGTGVVDTARRSALARALLEQIQIEAAAAGPPTETELRDLTESRWVEFDRPPAVRTRHALVLFKEGQDRAEARKLAEQIARTVRKAESADDFLELAESVDGGEFEIVVQPLPPFVTADGRTFGLDRLGQPFPFARSFDPAFSAAANAIEQEGTIGPVAQSEMGLHVIYLEKRFSEERVPQGERRERLGPEIVQIRAAAILQKILTVQAQRHPVVPNRAADALTAQVNVQR